MTKSKKLIVLLICMTIAQAFLSAQSTLAADLGGECGGNLSWALDADTHTLTISGTGDMADYTSYSFPWYNYRKTITSVIISDGVTSIGECAFYNCTALKSVTLPTSLTAVGTDAFRFCTALEIVHINDIEKWCGLDFGNEFANPLSYAEKFCVNNVIRTKIVLSETCTELKPYVFCGYNTLTNLTMSDNLTTIGDYAFYGCSSLSDIIIPSSVTTIGSNAFRGCALHALTIPGSVTNLSANAFYGCYSLTDITVCCNFGTAFNGLPFLKTVTLCDGVTKIDDRAFYNCSSLTDVIISEGVVSIGEDAFVECSALTNITIPSTLKSIGEDAFFVYGDSSLKNVYISDVASWCAVDFGGYNSNPLYFADNLYLNGTLTTSVVIPDTVTEIKPYAFYGFDGLSNVTIGKNVTEIGNLAFSRSALTEIIIPDNVKKVDCAFSSCSALTYAYIGSGVTSMHENAFSSSPLTDVVICCDAGMIFDDFTTLERVTLKEGVTKIDYRAFYLCSSLISVTIPEGVTQIGEEAFYKCSSLESVTIPSSIKSIGEMAFMYCTALERVYISDIEKLCLIDFGNYASNPIYFADSLYLNGALAESLVIPGTVTEIKPCTFYNLPALTSVTILSGVESIGRNAFGYCDALTEIFIPSSVTSVDELAFHGCNALSDVYYEGTEDDWANIAVEKLNTPLVSAAAHYSYISPIDDIFCGIGKYEGVIEADVTVSESGSVEIIVTRQSGTMSLETADIKAFVVSYSGGAVKSVTPLEKSATASRAIFTGTASGNYKIFLWNENMQPMTETIE